MREKERTDKPFRPKNLAPNQTKPNQIDGNFGEKEREGEGAKKTWII